MNTNETDWVAYENMNVTSSGQQSLLSGASYVDGYACMGYREEYTYAPNVFGYLQRKNSGITNQFLAKKFTFSAGTAVGTAVGIVLGVLSGSGLLVATATTLLSSVFGATIDYLASTTINVNTFRWDYRIRLGNNRGNIIATQYRTRDYWKIYVAETGAFNYQYRGSAYDDGYILSNEDMIKYAIDDYLY